MFERYTDKARRVIFFARYEASQFGSPYIETEHLLLGLLREDQYLREHTSVAEMRAEIRARSPKNSPNTVELELSDACKKVLGYAAKEAEGYKQIETEHILLGILRNNDAVARTAWKYLEENEDLRKYDCLKMSPEERRTVTLKNIHAAKANFQSVEGVLEEFFDSLEWAANRARFRLSYLRKKKHPGEEVGNA